MVSEIGEGGATYALSDSMFELTATCHERGWDLVADREGTRAGEYRFFLTMDAAEAKGGANRDDEGKSVKRCCSTPPLPPRHRRRAIRSVRRQIVVLLVVC